MMRGLRWLVLACAAGSVACGEPTDTTSNGRIRIGVTTSGADPQTDEYLVTLDGARPLSIAPNGSGVYDDVPEGTHVVHLFALADNCAVSGTTSPRSVNVRGGRVIEIDFTVVCRAPITGGFRVVVTTAGSPTDEDGYQLSVAGAPLRHIGVNAEETYQGLKPGLHLVTLKDVADFCEVHGGNPQPYTVVPGKTVRVAIRVGCGVGSGPVD
ncbi:MAG: hypothetical protein H0X69_05380 [Gemmatimonadales bacterium]|nr:hypothetical protein [Gemmatimonadales bacterium]